MDPNVELKTSSGFQRICVFCGSGRGKKPIYIQVAEQLGNELVKRGINLVYGGGSIGLMGTVAQAVQDAGGHVVGVIPKALMPKEICGNTVGDLIAVDDMHQRKAEMARRADAFIALPGGFGTFEEVLEIITWAQLGIHQKPVGLLNVDGYYDAMLALFDKALDEGFLTLASHHIVVSAPTAGELLDKLKIYSPTVDNSVPKLTWETTTGVAAKSPGNGRIMATRARATNSAVDSSSLRSASGARAFRASAVADKNCRLNGIRGSGLLQRFHPPGARPFFGSRLVFGAVSRPVFGIVSCCNASALKLCVG